MMETYDQNPIYNLSAVLHETGLKADLLRAWERRYELPKPQRTSGGHRLYSAYDIAVIKWLKSRQAEGLTISRAVDLWRSQLTSGIDPLAQAVTESSPFNINRSGESETSTAALRQRWLKACFEFDSIRAEDTLNQAFALHPVETVCFDVLQTGLREVGNHWYVDTVSVQQEHFASSLANRRLETLISLAPPPARELTVLLGCPPGERHLFPVLLLDLLLRRRGIRVVNLGADLPLEQMVATTLSVKPNLILLPAQTLESAASLQQTFRALHELDIPLAYGGLIFTRIPALRQCLPAHYLGDDLQEAPAAMESLLRSPFIKPTPDCRENPYKDLVPLFREKRPAIDLAVLQKPITRQLPFEFLIEANTYFGNGLHAALILGDPTYMHPEFNWVQRMLSSRGIPVDQLQPYLWSYKDAIVEELGTAGKPITDWLESITNNAADLQ